MFSRYALSIWYFFIEHMHTCNPSHTSMACVCMHQKREFAYSPTHAKTFFKFIACALSFQLSRNASRFTPDPKAEISLVEIPSALIIHHNNNYDYSLLTANHRFVSQASPHHNPHGEESEDCFLIQGKLSDSCVVPCRPITET
jgi:hypothetical protein